ncbi:MAG: hypothetical protein AAFZ52_09015 [Bacteroidota bacterium]
MRVFLYLLLLTALYGCVTEKESAGSRYEVPSRQHDLGYIPHDPQLDDSAYTVCDSTKIHSGRNRLHYAAGTEKLREDIRANYVYSPKYATFNGYVIVRFLVNCQGQTGRYRVQALHPDFSPATAPATLLPHLTDLIRRLNNWTKSPEYGRQAEYAKYINLQFTDGKLQYVLL